MTSSARFLADPHGTRTATQTHYLQRNCPAHPRTSNFVHCRSVRHLLRPTRFHAAFTDESKTNIDGVKP